MEKLFLTNMKDGFVLKLFRMLAAIFDSAFVYLIFFLCLLFPILNMQKEYDANGVIGVNNIIILLCFILLAALITFAYFFLFTLMFGQATLGMKMFFLKFETENNTRLRRRDILKRFVLLIALCILTLGLSLISDIISIVLSKDSQTFLDKFLDIRINKIQIRKEEL